MATEALPREGTAQTVAMLIDGRDTTTGATFEVRHPADGHVVATVAKGGQDEIEAALAAAHRAFPAWSRMPAHARAALLERAADLLAADLDGFAGTLTGEAGKPIAESRGEVTRSVELLRYAGGEARRLTGETIPLDAVQSGEGRFGFTLREPIGVIAAITPFNFPLALVAHKVAPALAAGNTVVLKPASATPLTALRLGRLFQQAGLPAGVLNVITAGGADMDALITDGRVAMISFTGSAPVGESIRARAGLKRVALELGSNSATIVHRDANIDAAALACSKAGYAFAGQVCISLQRVYVHRDVYDAFLERFAPLVRDLRVGDPFEPSTEVGPMLTEDEARRAEAWVGEAVQQGARVICGGTRTGSYFAPTVLADVSQRMRVICEEIFAPVVSVTSYETLDEAIALVNDSEFGLQAGVFTNDVSNAFHAARGIHTGGVIINDTCRYRADHMPYGGVKRSGMGREGVKYAMDEMTEIKMVVFNLSS